MNFELISIILALVFVSSNAGQAHGGFMAVDCAGAVDPCGESSPQDVIDVFFSRKFLLERFVRKRCRTCSNGMPDRRRSNFFHLLQQLRLIRRLHEYSKTSCRQRCPKGFQQDPSDLMMCQYKGNFQLRCTDHGLECAAGKTCKKKVIERTPYLGNRCLPSEEMDLGLCYPKCRAGYTGVGPVCWVLPPIIDGEQWVNCGMGAAKSSKDCGFVITDQILSPILLALNVVTFGTTGAIGQAFRTAKLAARVGSMAVKLGSAVSTAAELVRKKRRVALGDHMRRQKAIVDFVTNKVVRKQFTAAHCECSRKFSSNNAACKSIETYMLETENMDPKALDNADNAHIMDLDLTAERAARIGLSLLSLIDPTSITGTAAAYMYPKCSKLVRHRNSLHRNRQSDATPVPRAAAPRAAAQRVDHWLYPDV